MRMVQSGQRQGFLVKALARRFIGQGPGGQDLERHVAVQPLVVRPVDHTHPAGAELFENAVMPEGLADHRH